MLAYHKVALCANFWRLSKMPIVDMSQNTIVMNIMLSCRVLICRQSQVFSFVARKETSYLKSAPGVIFSHLQHY